MAEDRSFAQLVSLACHDLRTPLATVHGFAQTLARVGGLAPPADRYVEMIDSASVQMRELLDDLGLVARIEGERYEPVRSEVHTLDLARSAAERVGTARVAVSGRGSVVRVDAEPTERAFAALVDCALRHGGLERVEVGAERTELTIAPIAPAVRPIILGQELRDLGAAVGGRLVEALGGTIEIADETLTVRLPA